LVKNESIGKMAYEMGLNKWYIMSANAEEKKTRTNLKKLGCLFEAFLGALFLDFNKIQIHDEGKWFDNVFATGPGFQMAQTFVEKVFDEHVDWMNLLQKNDNYKNLLQVKLQKAFQVTPIYKEMSEWDEDIGYHMGVFLCIGYNPHTQSLNSYMKISDLEKKYKNSSILEDVEYYLENVDNNLFLHLGEDSHKIKKKAEQSACLKAIHALENKI